MLELTPLIFLIQVTARESSWITSMRPWTEWGIDHELRGLTTLLSIFFFLRYLFICPNVSFYMMRRFAQFGTTCTI